MENCPFHSRKWRGWTQYLLNQLRGNLLLPRHIRQFPRAVCTCKTGSVDQQYSIGELKQWCQSRRSGRDVTSHVRELSLYLLLESAEDGSEPAPGLVKVVALVKAAFEGDYHELEPKSRDGCAQTPGTPILKEKFEIPLSYNYIGVFIGVEGRHMKQLCSKYKASVQLGENVYGGKRRRPQYIHATGDTIPVTISHKAEDTVDVNGLKEELLKRAKTVNESREKHLSNVLAFATRQQKLYQQRVQHRVNRAWASADTGVFANPKVIAAEQFEKKKHSKSKQSMSAKSTSTNSALSEGHCFHCLAPYNIEEKDCQYHSGYLAAVKQDRPNQGYSWSCCKKRTAAKHPTHELHRKTGCYNGQHLWRPGKGAHAKGKSGSPVMDPSNKTNDFSV